MAESLFIAATPGLEAVLLDEARSLGKARLVPGGIRLTGADGLHWRANLQLRRASRVWLEVAQLKPGDRAGLRQLRDFYGASKLHTRIESGRMIVSVDTTGDLLHRRGYRQEVSRAPMRETLAAGLLALAGHRPDEPLWDPLCGSGTIAIEAALASRRILASRRAFSFERFPTHDPAAYAREREALASAVLSHAPAPIWASDLNAGSLGTARRNAVRAGVFEDLKLFRHDATQPVAGLPAGSLVISNLPYGKRAGRGADLPSLYGAVVEACRRSGAVKAGFLAADPRAAQWLGLEAPAIHPVDNGGLKCRFVVGKL